MRYALFCLSLAIAACAQGSDSHLECALTCFESENKIIKVCDEIEEECVCKLVDLFIAGTYADRCIVDKCGWEEDSDKIMSALDDYCKDVDDGDDGGEHTRDDIPECSRDCIHNDVESTGDCDAQNDDCLCDNWDAIKLWTYHCIAEYCDELEDYQWAVNAVEAFCEEISGKDD